MSSLFVSTRHLSRLVRGFTLIELLVVIAIIGVLVALLFPTFQNARKNSHTAPCMNHQRQIVTAMMSCAADNQGKLPDIAVSDNAYADSDRWDAKIAEYLNMPLDKFKGPKANALRCPAAKKTNAFSYGLNYAGGERRVFARMAKGLSADPGQQDGNQNYLGSQRLVNLPQSVILIADAYDPNNPESDLFYAPWGNYPLTTDQDGDGVSDSSGNLPPPRKFNCIDPRHGNGKAFIGTAVDGSAKLLTIREWAENPKYWGPSQ